MGEAQARERRRWSRWDTAIIVAVVAIVTGLVTPVFLRARTKGRTVFCKWNLDGVALDLLSYASDHDGCLPPAPPWADCVHPNVQDREMLSCPAAKPGGFAMNEAASGLKLEEITDRDHFILLFDGPSGWNAYGTASDVVYRHSNGAHFVLANGAIRWVEAGAPHPYRWEP